MTTDLGFASLSLRNPESFDITVTVLLTMVVFHFEQDRLRLLIFALALGLATTVIFRQFLPRLFVRNNPEHRLLLLLPVVRPLYNAAAIIAGPLNRMFGTKDNGKMDLTTPPEASEDRGDDNAEDFHALMEVGKAEGIIEENERELIESVVEFNETRVAEIMTPRTEICAIPVDSTIIAARQLMVEEKYSRIPVYRDSIDNIEGVIYVRRNT
ncbi:MAG: hypothetical protein IPM25_08280 [Chloracidobacterium sp.]|nr:hypothetical protein [Chloracidobacterium sp.]